MHNFLTKIQIQIKKGKVKEKGDPVWDIELPLCLFSGFFQTTFICDGHKYYKQIE